MARILSNCVLTLVLFSTPVFGADTAQKARAILSNRCFACHGPDEEQRQSGLRLDTVAGLNSEADSGMPAIISGKPDESELLRRILSTDESERMPPPEFSGQLEAEERAIIRQWITDGAQLPEHWSFVSPSRPALPSPAVILENQQQQGRASISANWLEHPVDRFVLRRMLENNFAPSPTATRSELLRRLYLDLIGLPPAPSEVKSFVNDSSPGAYERQVDKLLASPAFGEHWARKWLDLARYADSAGYADDPPRTIWGYRDWVINAINADLPLTEFTVQQLAGDMRPDATPEQMVATAFHRNTLTNNEGGTNNEEFRNVAIVDRVNTTMAVWMGVTMACAQCHTHKYDPFTQTEYFQLFDIFNQSEDADLRDERPTIPVYSVTQRLERAQLERQIVDLKRELDVITTSVQQDFTAWDRQLQLPKWIKQSAKIDTGKSRVTYSIKLEESDRHLQGLALRTSNGSLPSGNQIELSFIPAEESQVQARFVRIELPGKDKFLSLAEVEVFSDGKNIAISGTASQSSTDYGGIAQRANDGNTEGDYNKDSTTHTKRSQAPWWELDLLQSSTIESVVVWNRSDGNVFSRLDGMRISLLDENRKELFSSVVPKTSKTDNPISIVDIRPIGLERTSTVAPQRLALLPKQPLHIDTRGTLQISIKGKKLQELAVEKCFDKSLADWIQLSPELRKVQAQPPESRTASDNQSLLLFFARNLAKDTDGLRTQLASLEAKLTNMKPATTVPIMKERKESRETAVQLRGNYKITGEQVSAGTPAVFHPIESQRPTRIDLARWLVDRRNPLTARVWVNRMWESLFGLGIVRTSEEFGSQGDRPTHPELLDWLAVEFMDSGWNYKHMLRTIVTSRTYRQTSQVTRSGLERDKENIWLSRGPRVRLSAEMIRDQSLAAAGLLDATMFGPPVRPPQPDLGLKAAFGSATDWKTSEGADRYRRGIYTTWRRSSPYPSMVAFDAPSREVCTLKRDSTNTPLQALVTLNDPAYVEAAQGLARRVAVLELPGNGDSKWITRAFEICTGRLPQANELNALTRLFLRSAEQLGKDPGAAHTLATDPLGPLPAGADPIEIAALTTVCNVLLNLDEVLMKR